MKLGKGSMYKVASGQIAEPELTLEIDGESQVLKGMDARIFAFGYLAGLKAAREGINIEDATYSEQPE